MASSNGQQSAPRHNPDHMLEYDKRRSKRADRLFHWSLNMPPEDDDMDVRVNNNRQGFGWKELAVVAAGGLGAAWLFADTLNPTQPLSPPAQIPTQSRPVDSEYEVRFYDKDGNQITVPHISTKGRK